MSQTTAVQGEIVTAADGTVDVYAHHRFDVSALEHYMQKNVAGFEGPLSVRQFEGGQSNPTFLLSDKNRKYVMRKKPPGQLLKSAHAVDREYRIMNALKDTGVPVPRMLALCEDDSVVGAAFYVMEWVQGRIIIDTKLEKFSKEERTALYQSMNETLARLHMVDYKAIGLEDFGKPGNYFERQIGRWTKQYRDSQTDDIEAMENLIKWLTANIPADNSVSIAHGDYRLGNLILHPTEPRVIAVLDWELSTIGHPLADLAYNCMNYHDDVKGERYLGAQSLSKTGVPTEDEYVGWYCKRTGRDQIPNWLFYIAFSVFRSASIAQGVYKRGLDGNASSAKAVTYGNAARERTERIWAELQRAGIA